MQLHFSLEEVKLLAEVLEQQIQRSPGSSTANGLLDHVIERNLSFGCDELEDLAAILSEAVRSWKAEIAQTADVAANSRMKSRLRALEELCDKVTEACAMA